MCNFASFVVSKNGDVYWYAGIESHSEIINRAGLNDKSPHGMNDGRAFAKVEITPPRGDSAAPIKDWAFRIDESHVPDWFTDTTHKANCLRALESKIAAERSINVTVKGDVLTYALGSLMKTSVQSLGLPSKINIKTGRIEFHRDSYGSFGVRKDALGNLLPSVIDPSTGAELYYDSSGVLHRDGAPIRQSRTRLAFYSHGTLSRKDPSLPCVVDAGAGVEEWYDNGRLTSYRTKDGRFYVDKYGKITDVDYSQCGPVSLEDIDKPRVESGKAPYIAKTATPSAAAASGQAQPSSAAATSKATTASERAKKAWATRRQRYGATGMRW